MGTSLQRVRAFPSHARQEVGHELRRLQRGENPRDWKPIPSIGLGVREIRVHTGTEHRVVYVGPIRDTIYVLHAFQKHTRQTPRAAIALAKKRLQELQRS